MTGGIYREPRFLPAGESAIAIELGNSIDPELNARVRALDRLLLDDPFPGYLEAVPTYRSLLVFFNPCEVSLETVREHVRARASKASKAALPPEPLKEVPTVYDGEDLDEVARMTGLPREDVVRLHSEREYLVYMIGFTPGFAYMGSTHEKLALPRRATPRTRVPAGSVAIAMGQTGIYPSSTPGGWHLLGRAEHRNLFDLGSDPPSFFLPGDRVRFVPAEALAEFPPPDKPPFSPPPAVVAVEEGGLQTTVQDLGRFGYQRYGVPVAGAVDAPALRAANRLVGNPPGAAALECTVNGPRLRCLRSTIASVTGADLGAVVERADLGRWVVPPWSSFRLRPGNVVRFEGRKSGARAYVAFAGGIHVPEVLGSRSTYLTAGFGGYEGRALSAGDRLSTLPPAASGPPPGTRWPRHEPESGGPTTLRIVWGPQEDFFTQKGRSTLLSSTFRVGASSDRMGYRLEGPELEHRGAKEIVSDGMMLGGIQVPPNGLPIVMLADRATTGGYPKIATVATADIARLGQLLPGDQVRFEAVSLSQAREAYARMLEDEAKRARGIRGS